MSDKKNYIIGKAEELTSLTPPPKINPNVDPIYTFTEVIRRLEPQFEITTQQLNALSSDVCPRDFAVSAITLHPSYIAKGHFPRTLFREMGVRSLGSKGIEVLPDKWTRVGPPKKSPTTKIFIAGKRERLTEFSENLRSLSEDSPGASDLFRVWSIEKVDERDKIKENPNAFEGYWEVGLQLIPGGNSEFIKSSFISYASELGFELKENMAIEVSNLWFLPIAGEERFLERLAAFSFVRVVRPLPAMRSFRPLTRNTPIGADVDLPNVHPYASDVRVAILDCGLPDKHVLEPWVSNYGLSDPTANDLTDGPSHGLGVTSAFLFGPLWPGEKAPRPFSYVDHYRVLDEKVEGEDPYELYRTLSHLEDILLSRQYEFMNLSLGPDLPIDDDEIHPWTSLIDTYLADGETFLTIAAGNNGERNREHKLNRVQVPSDCVNALSVGAINRVESDWKRATYSAVGPGRSPGLVKPDLVAFGGDPKQYFHVPSDTSIGKLVPTCGTSFSAPYLLRYAVGVRAILGHDVSPLAIKALLINSANQHSHDKEEVGWGKVPDSINQIIESADGTAKILYQGELYPGKYLKVPVPMPATGIIGKVKIKATCCFSSPVDPQDTSMYTKAGVEITWRPSPDKTDPFFKQKTVATEAELRADAGKWESVLHGERGKLGTSLDQPCFEIHYMARDGGDQIAGAKASIIRYAFVVSIEAPKTPDIFNGILRSDAKLVEIQPRIPVPIPVSI
ncbi:TPA: S8 family peptidase [Klebsiella pneumoniae]|nr:S8 family peptidase [Klebsiella pneumoniae]HBY5602349.1 S8 family peptidase [Klebsiella pneumoniae]